MRNIPGGLLAAVQSESFNWADLVKVTLLDGTAVRMTSYEQTINIAFAGDAAADFLPGVLVSLGGYSAKIGLAIDETELKLLLDGGGSPPVVTADDVRKDFWNRAVVDVGFCDWSNIGLGSYLHRRYEIASGALDAGYVTFELRGVEHRLERNVAVPLTVNCRHPFGGDRCGVEVDAAVWQGATVYKGAPNSVISDAARAVVRPSTPNGFWFRAIVGGTSDSSSPPVEPTWPASLGATVVDNEVTWEAIHPRRQTGTVDTVTSTRVFDASDILTIADWFGQGYVIWLTGANAGIRQRINAHTLTGSPPTSIITLYDTVFDPIQVGDTFTIVAGCRKRPSTDCFTKYRNRWRVGAASHLADEGVFRNAAKG